VDLTLKINVAWQWTVVVAAGNKFLVKSMTNPLGTISNTMLSTYVKTDFLLPSVLVILSFISFDLQAHMLKVHQMNPVEPDAQSSSIDVLMISMPQDKQ